MRITGNMVNYYFVCKRKLWLFQHEIVFEQTNKKVQLGSILDQTSYENKGKHHVEIGDCKIVCVRMNDSLNLFL